MEQRSWFDTITHYKKSYFMNILLTGGAGYIGSHTIIELDKAGHTVVVVDNFVNSQPEALKRVAKIIGKEVPFIEADCRDIIFYD